MSFTQPWFLLLLLLLPLFGAIAWPRLKARRSARHMASLITRGLILLLLVLALAGIRLQHTSSDLATLFLLDVSDSAGQSGRQAGEAYLRQALASMGPNDRAGIILFGTEALVERPVSTNPNLGELASIPGQSYTNIAGAIQLGLTLFPQDTARRMVILSDGGANLGDARQAAQLAAANGVEVSVIPLPTPAGPEVRLDDLHAPATLHQGEQFDLTVKLHSTVPMTAPLQIFSEGRLVAQQTLALQTGDNSFVLPLVAGGPGFTTFQARLAPPLDTLPQNNTLDAFAEVEGPLTILLVAEHAGEGRPLAEALRQAGLSVAEIGPAQMPSDLGRLSEAAAVILVNVPAFKLAPRQLSLLQSYVRDLGHGLVVVGGEESYGPGGYFQTSLEETLPVEMTIKDKQRLPGMTLMMVIDKSGSMADGGVDSAGGPRKVELAKEAIYRSVDLLVPWDRIGVVAFDNAARWVLEPTPAVNTQEIKNAVGTIRADGGTDILAGLKLAAEAITQETSPVRHIVLLTDGGADPGGIPELTQELAEQGITLSVVAIGQGYAPFLEDVARLGGGRFHFADDASVIPQIFAQETSLASRSYLVEETFTPEVVSPSPILQGLTGLPPLRGYVATSAKLTAQLVLQGGTKHDPLLAQWQYGLGRAVAWTSDAKGQWAGEWIAWPEFPRFWAQAIRWTIVEGASGGLESQVALAEDRATITVEALDAAGNYRNNLEVNLSLIDPGLNQQTLSLRQTAPGLYEGDFRPGETGTYLLHFTGQDGDDLVAAQTRGFVMAYSPEYRATQADPTLLPDLATIGGGRVLSLDAPAEAFAHTMPAAQGTTDLWPWFLGLAILLLPLDVGLRRVRFGREELRQLSLKLQQAWAKAGLGSTPKRQPAVRVQVSSAGRLLKVKTGREASPPPIPSGVEASAGQASTTSEIEASAGQVPVKPGPEAGLETPPLSQPQPASSRTPPQPPAKVDEPASQEQSTVQQLMRVKRKRRGDGQ